MTREARNLADDEEPTVKSIMDDHHKITEVLVRYATGIDSRDWKLFRTCFTDDAHFDYGYLGTFENPAKLTEYMRRSHSGPSMHRLSNFATVVDNDHATARTYVDAVVMGPRGFGVTNAFGWYDDELRRTPAGWQIAFRRTQLHGIRLPGPLALIPPAFANRLAGLGTRLSRR